MEISDDIIRTDVIGSEDYEVEISLSNGEVTDMYCSCPYALDDRNCKHMAAVLYEWSENEAEEKKDEENAINTDLFQPAYTVNSHKKKLTQLRDLLAVLMKRMCIRFWRLFWLKMKSCYFVSIASSVCTCGETV